MVGLKGLGVSQGLADKGYIYTDRPPTGPARWSMFAASSAAWPGDQYVVDDGKAFDVQVLDPRGRQVWSGDVDTEHVWQLPLPFPAPADQPRKASTASMSASRRRTAASEAIRARFVVHEYQLEPIRLVVDTPRHVYYRGETDRGDDPGRVLLRRTAGRADDPLPAGRRAGVTATTDDKGEVEVQAGNPRITARRSRCRWSVQLPERNLATQTVFILATRGFSIATSTPREVFLAGETFETTITTTDAEGKPVGRELEATLYQVTGPWRSQGEKKIATKTVYDRRKGRHGPRDVLGRRGRKVLRPDHRPRPVREPDHGHPRAVDLRRQGQRPAPHPGRTAHVQGRRRATVRVHWREEPALALVTYQGAKVLGYRLVELKQGENKLDLPMTATWHRTSTWPSP